MPNVEVYIGSGIEHGSDHAVFERVLQLVSQSDRPTILFANIHLGGRQIDLVAAREDLTLVVEAKGYSAAVRGGTNGPWEVRIASGTWKAIPNLYVQTINAAYAVRDAMSQLAGADPAYPAAALVFTPAIPGGSAIGAGDFKASIVGLDDIGTLLDAPRAGQWPLAQWRALARHHNLVRVTSPQAAIDARLLAAEQLVEAYGVALRRTYEPLAKGLVSFDCIENGSSLSSQEVARRGAHGADLLLRGRSGCGKTLLASGIALDAFAAGRLPILLPAKHFEGRLRDLVQREAVLLDAPSAAALVASSQRLGHPITFIVDGYNECLPSRRSELTRAVALAARRYEASVVVTTQIPLERVGLLLMTEVEVGELSLATKSAIARQAANGTVTNDTLDALLPSVATGLEARLIGEVGSLLPAGASRYALFDCYVRKRLGSDAADGITALARIAGVLLDRIAFSLTLRDRDRFAEQSLIPAYLLCRLTQSNLLVERGERTSFGHELFLDAFAAEAVIRRANGSTIPIVEAISSPIHADRKDLIVGAIDDESFCIRVLSEIADASVIRSCVQGNCGRVARVWAERRCSSILMRVREEAAQLRFEISEQGLMGVRAEPVCLYPWTPQDRAILAAFPTLIAKGHYLDEVLETARQVDHRLAQEYERLRDLLGDKKISLRSGLFAACYVWGGLKASAVADICGPLHSGTIDRPRLPSLVARLHAWLAREDLSYGQAYVLLTLHRCVDCGEAQLGRLLPGILTRLWRGAPYHLRLELMMAAHNAAWRIAEEDRLNLVQALEELPQPQNIIDSTTLTDALKALGALEEPQADHLEVVRANLLEAFADQDDADRQALAFGIWYGQFDHPFDEAYCEVVSELSPADKKTLLTMAAYGAELESPFVSILMIELAALDDARIASVIGRWTALPPTQCSMRQDAIGNFAVAHIALSRLRLPLPNPDDCRTSDGTAALRACGAILYWMNRIDLSLDQRRAACSEALGILSDHELGVSIGILREFYDAHTIWSEGLSRLPGAEPAVISIGACFPAEVSEMARECLRYPTRQRGYFDWLEEKSTFEFAIQVLGQWGNAADIPLLRVWAITPTSGQLALSAIRKLEQFGQVV